MRRHRTIPPSLILIPFLLLAALALTPTTAASESTDPFTGVDGGRWWWRPPPGGGGGGGPGPERPYDMLELVSGLRWSQIAIDTGGLDHTPVAPGESPVFGERLEPGRAGQAMDSDPVSLTQRGLFTTPPPAV